MITLLVEILQRETDSGAMMILALSAVNYLLNKSEQCKIVFDNLGGKQIVEDLQISPYHEVYKLSSEIVDRHFGG